LSPTLQTEIVENLLSCHSWSKALSLLRLTDEEAELIKQHFEKRDGQVEKENLYLEEMRAKQLRALMRIDNSDLKTYRVPSQLVFRKTSRQFTRMLKDRIGTDYLLCRAKELLMARRFLSKRGLDSQYAGEWSNDFVYLPKLQNDQEEEMFEWKDNLSDENLEPVEEDSSDARSSPSIPDELPHKGDTIIPFGGHNGPDRQGQGDPASKPYSNEARDLTNKNGGVVRLRIGSEQAARIRHLEQQRQFAAQSNSYSTGIVPQFWQWNSLGQDQSAGIPNDVGEYVPVAGNFELPVSRVMGGQWSYASLNTDSCSTPTSSMRYREKLEQARVEAQMGRVEANMTSAVSTAENWNAFMRQPEQLHGSNFSELQLLSEQQNKETSLVAAMPPDSNPFTPEMSSSDPVTPPASKEVQNIATWPEIDTDMGLHSTPIRSIVAQGPEHTPQPASIASPPVLCSSGEEMKDTLDQSIPSYVELLESDMIIDWEAYEVLDGEQKSRSPAVNDHSVDEQMDEEEDGPEHRENVDIEASFPSDEPPDSQLEAQSTSLIGEYTSQEEQQKIPIQERSPSPTAPEFSSGNSPIQMGEPKPQDTMTEDACSGCHSPSDSETLHEESPAAKVHSVEPDGDDEDSFPSKVTETEDDKAPTTCKAPSKKAVAFEEPGLTTPKARSKTTSTLQDRRRSERINGPPRKQTLRKRK
jgi:hypothetical protein